MEAGILNHLSFDQREVTESRHLKICIRCTEDDSFLMMTTLGVSCQGKGKDPDAGKREKVFEMVELDFLCYSKRVSILISIHFKAKDRKKL